MNDHSLLLDLRALALKPVLSGRYLSKIITTHGIYYSTIGPIELLNQACLRHHSSKEGRKEASRKLLNFKNKPPFLISDEVGVFPTMSSIHPECSWIFNHFFNAEAVDKGTMLTFQNEISIIVPVSLHIIHSQSLKLHTLLSHAQYSKRHFANQSSFAIEPNVPLQDL